ncbi:MAG: zinc-binding dehydrogenase [Saprospiraceae bacterium]|nr:zinc-binding dehydrogenase [Saprospiraceae bacterium]
MDIRKAYYVKPGNFKNLELKEESIPEPDDHEVRVKIHSIGLNFADVFCLLGLYEAAPKEAFIPGLEYSGEVIKLGKKVSSFNIGDRVMGVTRFGAYCDQLNIDSRYVIALPNHWTFDHGASYLVQVLTAAYGLKELGNLKKGQTVLIHSAAGGVGLWANRICKQYECYTIGTVGSESKLPLLKQEGYDQSIVRDTQSFTNQLRHALAGRPLNLVMDSIGGSIMKDSYKALAPMGRLIAFGSAHYGERKDRPNYPRLIWKYLNRPRIDPQNMIGENKSVMGFNLIYLFDNSDIMHAMLKNLEQMELGTPFIGHIYSFLNLPDALREFQSGTTTGKLVIQI